MHHDLKIESQYFDRINEGDKTFEIRKNDRDFQVGDILHLNELKHPSYDRPQYGHYMNTPFTGNSVAVEVTYILHGPVHGLEAGYCIMGIEKK